MINIVNILLSILYTLKSLIVYSLITFIVLFLLTLVEKPIFNLFNKKMSWNLSALFSTYILSFVIVIIAYYLPYFLGVPMKGLGAVYNPWLFYLKLFGLFLLYALIIALITQVFIFLGSYIYSKLNYEKEYVKLAITILIISVILNILNLMFPWILGGLIVLIYF